MTGCRAACPRKKGGLFMTAPLVIRVKDRDNVAIAVHDLETGVEVMPGVVTRDA